MPRAWTAVLVALALLGCADDGESLDGPPVDVFGGEVQGFARETDGAVDQVGLRMPFVSIENAAGSAPSSFVIELPERAREAARFDHVRLDFYPAGHGPPGVYDTPHFDVHFYLIDVATREGIACPETAVSAERLPAGYTIPGLDAEPGGTCAPQMGVHALNLEGQAMPFTSALIFNYHAGELVALEAMIAKDYLETLQTFTTVIPRPAALPAGVRLPETFTATFDERRGDYDLTLRGFPEAAP